MVKWAVVLRLLVFELGESPNSRELKCHLLPDLTCWLGSVFVRRLAKNHWRLLPSGPSGYRGSAASYAMLMPSFEPRGSRLSGFASAYLKGKRQHVCWINKSISGVQTLESGLSVIAQGVVRKSVVTLTADRRSAFKMQVGRIKFSYLPKALYIVNNQCFTW